MKTTLALTLVTALFLSGCTHEPSGFKEAPAAMAHLTSQLNAIGDSAILQASICQKESGWTTSIVFENRTLYHYVMDVENRAVSLLKRVTKEERDTFVRYDERSWECLGDKWSTPSFFIPPSASYTHPGRYRVLVEEGRTTFYVENAWMARNVFSDTDKAFIDTAAHAIKHAMHDQATYQPKEKTWGVE